MEQKEIEKLRAELKAKHGTIFELAVENSNGDVKIIYLKELDRKTYDAGSAIIKKNELQGAEVMIKGLYVGGDPVEEITGDFQALRAAASQLIEIIAIKPATIKKI